MPFPVLLFETTATYDLNMTMICKQVNLEEGFRQYFLMTLPGAESVCLDRLTSNQIHTALNLGWLLINQ